MLNLRPRTAIVRRSHLSLPIAGLLGAALILAGCAGGPPAVNAPAATFAVPGLEQPADWSRLLSPAL